MGGMLALGDLAMVSAGMGLVGRASGARAGSWRLHVVESADLEDDRLRPRGDGLRTVNVEQTAWTEKQLLKPFDILVTARSRSVKVALVPAELTRTVASTTLLVLRTVNPSLGLAHYLYYFLTSTPGRRAVEGQITQGVTIPTLSAAALRSVQVPVPETARLRAFPQLVEAAAVSHDMAIRAARIRREVVRDAVVASFGNAVKEDK